MTDPTPTPRPRGRSSVRRYAARVLAPRHALVVAAAVAAALPAAAGARTDDGKAPTTDKHGKAPTVDKSPLLWATINVCDTKAHPDTIGIRASMPGAPKGTRMAMRFRVQYKTDAGWQDIGGASSGWEAVGVARGLSMESGWSFSFAHPSTPVVLRGMVQLRWRKGAVVARTLEISTEAGHRSSAGADPADYSAATCTLGS
jgi:hypothetical protein